MTLTRVLCRRRAACDAPVQSSLPVTIVARLALELDAARTGVRVVCAVQPLPQELDAFAREIARHVALAYLIDAAVSERAGIWIKLEEMCDAIILPNLLRGCEPSDELRVSFVLAQHLLVNMPHLDF